MTVLIVADDDQKEELLQGKWSDNLQVEWVAQPGTFNESRRFDACLDLQFQNSPKRIALLRQTGAELIIINSVITPLTEIQEDFIRINGWNTFLKRPVIEAACRETSLKEKAEIVFTALGRKTEWVPDVPGLITARVIAAVINEAYFSLEEKVSSKEEIDTAMKLGTNYPYGPFEWEKKVGPKNIYHLLERLAKEQKRYTPASLLIKDASI